MNQRRSAHNLEIVEIERRETWRLRRAFRQHRDVPLVGRSVVSLEGHLVRDEGVAGSNPATPTNKTGTFCDRKSYPATRSATETR